MAALPKLREADLFDEAGYSRLHPGVSAAVGRGEFASGRDHYEKVGRAAGLRANDVDAAFYLRTYPQISEAFGPLDLADCAVHYIAYGRGRGYLPCRGAERWAVPGGLWTDAPDALDRIDREEASGVLTDRQAAMLRTWWADGILVLDRPAARDRLAPATLDLERLFAGGCPDVLFACPALGPDRLGWTPEINPNPAAALDVHFVSRAIRALMLGEPLAEFLGILLQGSALLGTSQGFIRPPMTAPRRSSDTFVCGVADRFLSVWIAVDETTQLTVWKGSHRGGWARRADPQPQDRTEAPGPSGPEASTLDLKRGTVLLLHPRVAHSSEPVAPLGTARALAAGLCPEALMPLYAEQAPVPLYRQGGHRFASGLYRGIEPLI